MPESSPPGSATGNMLPATISQSRPTKGPYEPPSEALVRTLQTTVRYSGKVWWNEWIGDPFLSKKGTPNGGAKGWLRRKFVAYWWLDNMPGVDISDQDKLWYFDGTKIGGQIYTYVNNSSVRNTGGCDPNGLGASKDEPVIKQRTFGHDFWRREHRDKYDEAVEEWKKKHDGKEPNFGDLRKISFDAFVALPEVEKEPWNAKAKEALEASQSQAGVPLPSSFERAKFHDTINKELDDVLKRGETKANIRLIGVIVHERPDGMLKIDRKFSNSLQAFSNNPAVSNLLHVFGEWIEETGGEPVEGCEPTATVYPNYAKENYPAIPNYIGWTLEPLQGLVRGSIKGIFAFQGGIGRVMWTEIKGNATKFIQPHRIPQILLDNWEDPSRFSMQITTTWTDFLLACFKKQIPDDRIFQFALIPGGTKPIHPNDSQEDSREQVERDSKLVWMLSFTKTVDYCHQPKGPTAMLNIYPKGAIAYADWMAAGKVHADAICAPPASWLSLPGANSSISDVAICPAEMEYWLDLSKFLSDSSKGRPTLLLDRTNAHQFHLPAIDLKGIYKLKKPLPILIPLSPQPSAVPSTMHLPLPMCQRNPPPNATIGCYEEFFEDTLDKQLLVHEPSGTLFGGDTGVVGLSRSLLHLYFSFCVARREFSPPESMPAGYDTSRLPLQEHDRLCGWIDRLCDELDKSTKILAQTSAERRGALEQLLPIPRDNDTPTAGDPLPVSDNGPQTNCDPVSGSLHALGPPSSKPKSRKRRTKSNKGKQRAKPASEDEASPESEGGGGEDYEVLDKTAQDDDDSWLNGEDSFSTMPQGNEPPEPVRVMEEDLDLDRLELGRRYGFTGVDSTQESLSYDANTSNIWVQIGTVFGKFGELPPYDALHFHTPNALILHIDNITRSCRDAMEELGQYLNANPRAPHHVHQAALAQAQDYPKHQALYEYIYLCRGIWHDSARVAVNGIFSHGKRLALILRESAQAQLMAHNTVQHGVFPDPNVGPVELAQAVRRLNKAAAEIRWTIKELAMFQTHATKWYNDLQGNWLYGDVPSDVSTLIQVVKGLTNWSDETMATIATLRSKRKVFWEKHVNLPFEPRHMVSGMRFRFGSPCTKEEPDGLRGAFNHAQVLLANSTPTPSIGGSEAQVENQLGLNRALAAANGELDEIGVDIDEDNPILLTILGIPPSAANPSVGSDAATPAPPSASATTIALAAPIATAAPASAPAPTVPVTPAAPSEPVPAARAASTPVSASLSSGVPVPRAAMPPPTQITISSTSRAPSMISVLSTALPIDPLPRLDIPASKRQREDQPLEPQQRRASKRISAAAVTAADTAESDLPRRTRAAVTKAIESNAKAVGKEGTSANGRSKRTKR